MTTQTRLAPMLPAAARADRAAEAAAMSTLARAQGDKNEVPSRSLVKTLAGDCWTAPPDGADPTDPERPLLACLTGDGRTLYPCWQFDSNDRPRPELAQVLAPMAAAGVTGWMIAAWLLTPHDDLCGLIPIRVLSDPHGDHAAVCRVATHHAGGRDR